MPVDTQCRLVAQSKNAKALNPAKLGDALGRCSQKLSDAFAKATLRYGAACAATEPSSAFDEYLTQCSDDTAAAAGGAALPDYAADLASCNGDLSTRNGDLASCSTNLATTAADLTACEGDLAACEGLPPARLLKTGQTTSYGTGTDGDLQIGITQTFVDNGDGTITDTKTGLVWEKKSDDGSIHDKDNTYTWCIDANTNYVCDDFTNAMDGTVATTFLAGLNTGGGFAGYTDWRLPNRKELESLTNLGAVNPATFTAFNSNCDAYSSGNPGCTVTTCSCTAPNYHWSSSTYAYDLQNAWRVNFGNGDSDAINRKPIGYHVRAVRAGF